MVDLDCDAFGQHCWAPVDYVRPFVPFHNGQIVSDFQNVGLTVLMMKSVRHVSIFQNDTVTWVAMDVFQNDLDLFYYYRRMMWLNEIWRMKQIVV